MANVKASKKDILVNARNRARNVSFKSRMRTYVKRAVAAIEAKAENRADVVREALQVVDKTAAKGVIKKQTAARKKSRLTIALNRSNL